MAEFGIALAILKKTNNGVFMSADQSDNNYISVHIHKNFYHDDRLETATLVKEYARVESLLIESGYIACLTIQVDQLKRIEYQYGSMVHSDLLRQTADLLKEMKRHNFRDDDILMIDLLNNDTFVIFFSAPRDKETKLLDHLDDIADRTRKHIEQPIFNLFYPYIKHISRLGVGYALAVQNPMINNMRLIMQLVANAKKMGEFAASKQEYKSKYGLQKIIIERSISSVFQPIVDMQSLDIIGYEALSRGPSGTEFENPLLLFTLAEDFGLSFELDSLCRKKAFESIRGLGTDKKIFVNTLAMTIHDPEFRGKYLEELLADIKIKPENVIFEINEKMAIDNYDLFRSALKDYSDIGIIHANDDIGAGYSDLERIMELNPGFMKIDISLVREVDKSYIKKQLIKAMVTLAKNLDSRVIAEGIETKEEYQALRSIGVNYGQGFLFGRPSPTLEPADTRFLQ